jgi:hypothetical protein
VMGVGDRHEVGELLELHVASLVDHRDCLSP